MRSLCDKIEDYMRSPLQIDAEKTLLKKLSIGDKKSSHHMASRHYSGALAVLGGGAFAYMAGPGLLIIGERLKLERNLFRSFSLNSRSGAVEALNVTGVAAAGGKILATDVSGDSMLNFFQDISSNKFFRRCYAQVFFLHEISSNRYVHDILHGIFMGFYAPV